jgi:hypothetical protein
MTYRKTSVFGATRGLASLRKRHVHKFDPARPPLVPVPQVEKETLPKLLKRVGPLNREQIREMGHGNVIYYYQRHGEITRAGWDDIVDGKTIAVYCAV